MTNVKPVIVDADGKVDRPMVGWYEPAQVIQTALSVVVSTVFGRHADFRLIEALTVKGEVHRFDDHGDEAFWFDYAADVGDGWNSSYAIAYWLAQPELSVRAEDGSEIRTERGSILVFGGDSVYPVASRAAYREKLVQCYESALAYTPESTSPSVLAIPGNHDWYDSLASFMRLFCMQRWFGGWRTQQRASYFAAKLPHGWWLIGVDIQLDSDIDDAQVKFLTGIAAQMQEGERAIFCIAEPHWIYAKNYGALDSDYNESNLTFIEQEIFHNRIAAFIAGDLHHYRRHASPEGVQKITAGGGGAFLHPTHSPAVEQLADDFALKAAFPDSDTSRRLAWRNLAFLWLNPTFGVVTAILYLVTGWATRVDLSAFALADIVPAAAAAFNKVLNEPVGGFCIVFVVLLFYLFTDTHSKTYRFLAGTLHGLVHLLALFLLIWLSCEVTVTRMGLAYGSTSQLLCTGAMVFVGGWIVGPIIMGLYLLISVNGFGRHSNEAFSSLKIEDWKHFLRLKIDTDGTLTLFAVGLRRVPRKWKRVGEPGERSCIVPNDSAATAPQLIDTVVIRK